MSHNRLAGWLMVLAGLITPLGIISTVKINQIGPRAFWATDVCPDPAAICGNIPLVLVPAALVGFAMLAVGHRVAYPDYEWSKDDIEDAEARNAGGDGE